MKIRNLITLLAAILSFGNLACTNSSENSDNAQSAGVENNTPATVGQSGVQDDVSQPNVVKIAVGSKDHTTLVKAVQAAELVDALSNNGPFTVFAPTDAAFAELPAGTLEELLKKEKKGDLETVLYNHVIVGSYKAEDFRDAQEVTMFGGKKVVFSVKDGKVQVNGANILATVPASNGYILVIDKVL